MKAEIRSNNEKQDENNKELMGKMNIMIYMVSWIPPPQQ